MKIHAAIAVALFPILVATQAGAEQAGADVLGDSTTVERGRYLVRISGCNDCHTPGYLERNGQVPEAQWLTGTAVGFQGPWGTTYPSNLRHSAAELTEQQWVERAREPMRPPMPWFNLSEMTDRDLVSIYRYLRSLGDAGEPAPMAVAPGHAVSTPYIDLAPKIPHRLADR